MECAKPLIIAILVFSLPIMAPYVATAETFVDIYGGAVLPEDEDLSVHVSAGGTTSKESRKVDYDNSFTVGGRLGYWFTETDPVLEWFALALDVSFFKTEVDNGGLDIYVVPISGLLMLRYPGDTFQPYIGVGGGIFISYADQDVDLSSISAGTKSFSDTSVDAGFDARGGLAVKFLENFAIFVEGRYTYFKPEYKDNLAGANVEIKTDSEVYHALAGISYRF